LQVVLIEGDPLSSSTGWLAEKLAGHGFIACRETPDRCARERRTFDGSRAVVLDLGTGTGPAADHVRLIRRAGLEQPCLVLSAHDDWRDKIECLDAGADDYVVKPVRSEEVAARLRAMIRRASGNATDRFESGDLVLDLRVRCAWLADRCLDLTRNEFRLLRMFLLEPGKVMTHQEIHRQLYPDRADCSTNAIEVQIARLRRKIGRTRIRTIRGLGYRYFEEGIAPAIRFGAEVA